MKACLALSQLGYWGDWVVFSRFRLLNDPITNALTTSYRVARTHYPPHPLSVPVIRYPLGIVLRRPRGPVK